jgi:hypothetical protein
MQDELLLNWTELVHISIISVTTENNKIPDFVNRPSAGLSWRGRISVVAQLEMMQISAVPVGLATLSVSPAVGTAGYFRRFLRNHCGSESDLFRN